MKDYSKKVLTADGLADACVDRRVADYDTLDKEKIINSKDIDDGLVDTYGLFDLTELSCGVDESEQQHFADMGCDFGGKSIECEIDCKGVVKFMAQVGADFFEREIDGLQLRVVSIYSPRYYNDETDSCEWLITKNPFDTVEKLVAEMKRVAVEEGFVSDSYRAEMYEQLDNYLFENITGYTVDNETYTYNDLVEKFGGKDER